jgi:pyrroline-5-carboxylate reductase
MNQETLAFIGGGNMAESLIGGLLKGATAPSSIRAVDPIAARREYLTQKYGIETMEDSAAAIRNASVVVLAVKPQVLRGVAQALAPHLAHRPLIISVVAGIRSSDLARWLGGLPVVRSMPNTPALMGCGITALYATEAVPTNRREVAASLMAAVGDTVWVTEESHMDTVTAVSGSGPAYFFLLIEMLEAAGVELGLPQATSRQLAIATAHGAGNMARAASVSPAQLREQVTSKGGTTAAALGSLEGDEVRAIFARAVAAAARRSAEMGDTLGAG